MDDLASRFVIRIDDVLAAGGVARVVRADEAGHAGMPRDASLLEQPRLIIALEGQVEFERKQGEARRAEALSVRDALFVAPGRWVRARVRRSYASMGVVFLPEATRYYLMRSQPAPDGRPGTPVETYVHPEGIGEEGRALTRLLAGPVPAAGGRFFVAAAECLLVLARELLARPAEISTGGKARFTWQAACDYMLENLHRPLSRKDVARHLDVHPNHLSRLFAEFGPGTFGGFLLDRRLERARLLLEDPRLNVAGVARLAGFSSANYFTRVFHARTGRTPTGERSGRVKGGRQGTGGTRRREDAKKIQA